MRWPNSLAGKTVSVPRLLLHLPMRSASRDPVSGGGDFRRWGDWGIIAENAKKAGRGWHHHSRALRRRLMGQGE
jgi:hypothetical protein